jgi:hypothetical protein
MGRQAQRFSCSRCHATRCSPARRLYLARGFGVQGVLRGAMKDGEHYFHEDLMILQLPLER